MFAFALTLSVVGLLVGPGLVAWGRGRTTAIAALDGATLGIVPALLLARLLPHLVEEVGAAALLALVFGYVAFLLAESRAHGGATRVGLAFVLPTLAVHSFLDGAALAVACSRSSVGVGGAALGGALVLHKVPEGLFLASRLTPAVGERGAFTRIAALGATTVLGGLTGRELLAHAPDKALHIVVAVGLGVMLRMVLHRHDEPEVGPRERAASGFAFVACVVLSIAIPSPFHLLDRSQPNELPAARAIVPLFLESAPWLLGVLAVSEAMHLRRGRTRRDPGGTSSAWLAANTIALVLLGPVFAAGLAILDPLVRGVGSRRRAFATVWLDEVAPRAASVLPAYAAGVVLSIVAEAALPRDSLGAAPVIAIPLALLAAHSTRLGPCGAVVLAAVLVHKGAPPAAGLAFVLGGACGAAKSRRTRLLAFAVAAGFSALAGALPLFWEEPPPLHDLGAHRHRVYEWVAGAVLAVWTLAGLVRQGPRDWFRSAFLRDQHPPSDDVQSDAAQAAHPARPASEALDANHMRN